MQSGQIEGSAGGRLCPVLELVPPARPSRTPLRALARRLGTRPHAPFPALFLFSVSPDTRPTPIEIPILARLEAVALGAAIQWCLVLATWGLLPLMLWW